MFNIKFKGKLENENQLMDNYKLPKNVLIVNYGYHSYWVKNKEQKN